MKPSRTSLVAIVLLSLSATTLAAAPAVVTAKAEAFDTHYLVQLPTTYTKEKPWPLLVALHGFGDCAKNFLKVWSKTADSAGYVLVAPLGDARTCQATGRRPAWSTRSPRYILWVIEQVRKKYAIDKGRIHISGFSAGGAVACLTGLKHPDVFTSITAFGSVLVNLITAEDLKKSQGLPVRIIVGGKDPAHSRIMAGVKRLRDAGFKNLVLRPFPELGHAYPLKENGEIVKWLDGLHQARLRAQRRKKLAAKAALAQKEAAGANKAAADLEKKAAKALAGADRLLAQGEGVKGLHALDGVAIAYGGTPSASRAAAQAKSLRADSSFMKLFHGEKETRTRRSWLRLADNFRKNGMTSQALAYYRKVLRSSPNSTEGRVASRWIRTLQ